MVVTLGFGPRSLGSSPDEGTMKKIWIICMVLLMFPIMAAQEYNTHKGIFEEYTTTSYETNEQALMSFDSDGEYEQYLLNCEQQGITPLNYGQWKKAGCPTGEGQQVPIGDINLIYAILLIVLVILIKDMLLSSNGRKAVL